VRGETHAGIDGVERRLREQEAGKDAIRLHDEAGPALISRVEDRFGSDVRQIFVECATDDCLDFARIHTGMLPSLRPFSYPVR
jgi:hypothetical protein